MACGCPVIASDVGENPYLVPSDTGILVNGTDDWLDAIEAMTDQSRRTKMGFRAREHVKEEYSLPVIASKIQAELEWIL
jgi:glycosyltransferase involved in cell wall biosynthesis